MREASLITFGVSLALATAACADSQPDRRSATTPESSVVEGQEVASYESSTGDTFSATMTELGTIALTATDADGEVFVSRQVVCDGEAAVLRDADGSLVGFLGEFDGCPSISVTEAEELMQGLGVNGNVNLFG